jgi:16S rRNA (cytosine967-C5)-methyltransferase
VAVIIPARKLAFDVLRLVESGGFAAELLYHRSAALEARDAALASELVMGVLRRQNQLDFLLEHFSGRPADRLDPEVRIALRMGLYQLRYLDRIPAHAAVGESVELVKRAGKHSASGLVNAVLRQVHRQPVSFPDLATELAHPAWLLERWERQYGPEQARRIALANLETPETYVRLPVGYDSSLVRLEPTEVPDCFRVLQGTPAGLRIQDISSQAIVPLLELAPGQWFLDVCAAPGNKTAQAIELGVRAVACDVHPKRLAALKTLGCHLVVADGTRTLPFARRFDRILVDAPCSGTGTLARNPEIKWRLRPSDLADLHARQVALLSNALERLAPGGRLVYSTCSLEAEENEEVVREVLDNTAIPAGVAPWWRRLPGRDRGDGFFAAVITSDKPLNDSNRSFDSLG